MVTLLDIRGIGQSVIHGGGFKARAFKAFQLEFRHSCAIGSYINQRKCHAALIGSHRIIAGCDDLTKVQYRLIVALQFCIAQTQVVGKLRLFRGIGFFKIDTLEFLQAVLSLIYIEKPSPFFKPFVFPVFFFSLFRFYGRSFPVGKAGFFVQSLFYM
jgi:hypothetical protein